MIVIVRCWMTENQMEDTIDICSKKELIFFDNYLSLTEGNKIFMPLDGIGHEIVVKVGEKYNLSLDVDKVYGNLKQCCSIHRSYRPETQVFVDRGVIFTGDFRLDESIYHESDEGNKHLIDQEKFSGTVCFAVPFHPHIHLEDGLDYLLFRRTRDKDKIDKVLDGFITYGYQHVFSLNDFY